MMLLNVMLICLSLSGLALASYQSSTRGFTFPARLAIEDLYSAPPHGQAHHDSNAVFESHDASMYIDANENAGAGYLSEIMLPEMQQDTVMLLQSWKPEDRFEASSESPSVEDYHSFTSKQLHEHQLRLQELANRYNFKYASHIDFPVGAWQEDYPKEQVEMMFWSIIKLWPKEMEDWIRKKCSRSLYHLLLKHQDLRKDLLAGDEATIRRVALYTSPEKVLARARGPNRDGITGERWTDHLAAKIGWIHGHLTQRDHDKIMTNLMRYWKIPHATAISRLLFYTQTHGLITSPEPLLSEDEVLFAKAAALVYNSDSPGRNRILGPEFQGNNDILHQPSEMLGNLSAGPFFTDYGHWTSLPTSQRYNSHEWHKHYTHAAKKTIHTAVVRQWVPWLNAQYINRHLIKVNDFLQENPEYIQLILDGDQDAAFTAARESISAPMLRIYNQDFQRLIQQGAVIV